MRKIDPEKKSNPIKKTVLSLFLTKLLKPGKVFTKNTLYNTVHILPMYHPAVATYNPNKKNELLEDIKQVKPFILSQSISH